MSRYYPDVPCQGPGRDGERQCGKPSRSRNRPLCSGHLEQARRGWTLRPLGIRRPQDERERPCSFDGCTKPNAGSDGLCWGHQEQSRRGQELKPLIRRRSTLEARVRNDVGDKECFHCRSWKHEDAFDRRTNSPDGLHSTCRHCRRSKRLEKVYGITADAYDALLEAQGGACSLCNRTDNFDGRGLAVDHDHACCPGKFSCGRCVRGLLCNNCNTMLGLARDDVEMLSRAITYLKSGAPHARVVRIDKTLTTAA